MIFRSKLDSLNWGITLYTLCTIGISVVAQFPSETNRRANASNSDDYNQHRHLIEEMGMESSDTLDLSGTTDGNPIESIYNVTMFQGDIIPTWDYIVNYYGIELADEMVEKGDLQRPALHNQISSRGTSPTLQLWNNDRRGGVCWIPIYISSAYNRETVKEIISSVRNLERRAKVFKFQILKKKLTNGKPFLYFRETPGKGCSSFIGLVPEFSYASQGQVINLQESMTSQGNCIHSNTIQHELMHALGFYHEHSRPDRDNYIEINWGNINQNDHRHFYKANVDSLGSPYDFESIMHYHPYSFAIDNTVQTIVPKHGKEIVYSKYASYHDLLQLRLMYQCSSGPRRRWQFRTYRCSEDCKCWEGMVGCKGNDKACQKGLICNKWNRCVTQPQGYPTIAPTPRPPPRNTLISDYSGTGWFAGGIMFDIEAQNKPIVIENFYVFLRSGTWNIEVFTRWGTAVGFHDKPEEWTKIGQATMEGNNRTPPKILPAGTINKSQRIQKFSKRGFYITTASASNDVFPFLFPSMNGGLQGTWMENWQVAVKGGVLFNGKFSSVYWDDGYGFWGGIEYTI